MTTWEPELAGDRPPLKPGHVWLTRRRWDAYFLVGVLASGVCGVFGWWLAENPRALIGPLVLVPLWLLIRLSCPREGHAVRAASKTPGMVPFLIWMAVWLVVGLVSTLILDRWLTLPAKGEDWISWQGLVITGCVIAWNTGLLVSVARLDPRFKKSRPADPGGLD